MRESKQESTQSAHTRSPESKAAVKLHPERDPDIATRIEGRSPLNSEQLNTLGQGRTPYSVQNQHQLLQLQRQYGNAYVQRRVELSRKVEGPADATPEVEAGIEQARGGGQPLEHTVQRQMESAFGTDFSGVRVHTDAGADRLNQDLEARAFTTRQDIFFRRGEYSPGSASGKELLAHELTHVVQQTGVIQPKLTLGQPNDPYEQEADQIAHTVVQQLVQSPAPMDALADAQGAVIQREPVGADQEAKAVPTVVTGTPDAAATTNAHGKSVNIVLTALYEDVPGEAKDKVKRSDADDALWFDPLMMLSNYPVMKRSTAAVGVVAGGQKTVDTFSAPVTEGDNSIGRGSISAELKYASERNKSFKVTVSGLSKKDTPRAEAEARTFIQNEIKTYGDVDEIAKDTETKLTPNYPGATVSITTSKDKVMDAGQSTFFYKVQHDAGILMEVLVAPVGEKQTRYSGSKTAGSSTADESSKRDKSTTGQVDVKDVVKDSEKKTATSKESVETEYNEAIVRTLEDYVTKSTTIHNEVASDLAETVVTDSEYHKDDVWKEKRRQSSVEDYTKKVKGRTESGVAEKENWAAKLKKGIKILKKATSIPYIDKIPGIGWITRRVKGWQLDLAEAAADLFAESGQVNYTDTKEDTTVKKDTTAKDDTDGRNDVNIKKHDVEETKRILREDYKNKTDDEWKRHMEDVTTTTKKYKSLTQKDSASTVDQTHTQDYSKKTKQDESEAEQRHKENEHKTTTTTFEVSNTWKYTKPVIKATVVSGDAVVNNVPFPPEANESNPRQ
jgi:hypothetical protein